MYMHINDYGNLVSVSEVGYVEEAAACKWDFSKLVKEGFDV